MKRLLSLLSVALLTACAKPSADVQAPSNSNSELHSKSKAQPIILIHGGAGFITANSLAEEDQESYRKSLQSIVDSGYHWLENGIAGDEVVARVIMLMESDSLYNSGVGAVVNARGFAELDASIMRGSDLQAGAISGVHHIEHPILLAKYVMDSSAHVMLSGQGAEEFGYSLGLDSVPNDIFITSKRRVQYRKAVEDKHGTVGAVVLDSYGNLAAGTSTGGMMMKEYGRIGDSPIIGAGTYADNNGCAVSCTGHGEYFIRHSIASQLSFRVQSGEPLDRAAHSLLFETLNVDHGAGGLIAIDINGNYSMPFNTAGMFRGMKSADSTFVALFAE